MRRLCNCVIVRDAPQPPTARASATIEMSLRVIFSPLLSIGPGYHSRPIATVLQLLSKHPLCWSTFQRVVGRGHVVACFCIYGCLRRLHVAGDAVYGAIGTHRNPADGTRPPKHHTHIVLPIPTPAI